MKTLTTTFKTIHIVSRIVAPTRTEIDYEMAKNFYSFISIKCLTGENFRQLGVHGSDIQKKKQRLLQYTTFTTVGDM